MSRPVNYTKIPRPILWLIRGGEVCLGNPELEDASPTFTATVKPFYIAKSPLTNEQYEAFDPSFERSRQSPGDRDLATGISWQQAAAYCDWYQDLSGRVTRLPTEFEWEFACRGGTQTPGFWSPSKIDEYAVHAGNAAEVGAGSWERLKPNPVGLYSMLGGIWEWTDSDYLPYPGRGQEWPAEPRKVLRGGCWRDDAGSLDAARRRAEVPAAVPADAGFRILRPFGRD